MANNKINWILILQAWTMLYVIIGHSPMSLPITDSSPFYAEVLFKIAYSFHMPLFILISGYLFYMTRVAKPMGYRKMIHDKLQRLGIPFVVFTIFALALKTIFSSNVARPTQFSTEEFIKAFIYPFDGPMQEFWFITVIMWCFISRPIFCFFLENFQRCISFLILLLIIREVVPVLNNDMLCISRTFNMMVFFFGGMVLSKYNLATKIKGISIGVVSLTIFVTLYILGIDELNTLKATAGIVFSIVLAHALDKYANQIFITFRDYTYQIYLMGLFVQIFIKILYKHGLFSYDTGFIICIVLGIYIPVLISKCVEKLNWNPLLLIIGLSKK